MRELQERMKEAWAKSTVDVSLFDHSVGVLTLVDQMIRLVPNYSSERASILRLGAFFHDIGKLHPEFQLMLRGQSTASNFRVKHEAQTLYFTSDLEREVASIAEWIEKELTCQMIVPPDLSEVLAFAVTHHGLYYMALEQGEWRVRREWSAMNPEEERRITLADLLLRYYPLGGAVILADLLHSEQLVTKEDNVTMIRQAASMEEWKRNLLRRKSRLLLVPEADRPVRMSNDLLEMLLM